jgi:hypothetical protein
MLPPPTTDVLIVLARPTLRQTLSRSTISVGRGNTLSARTSKRRKARHELQRLLIYTSRRFTGTVPIIDLWTGYRAMYCCF